MLRSQVFTYIVTYNGTRVPTKHTFRIGGVSIIATTLHDHSVFGTRGSPSRARPSNSFKTAFLDAHTRINDNLSIGSEISGIRPAKSAMCTSMCKTHFRTVEVTRLKPVSGYMMTVMYCKYK